MAESVPHFIEASCPTCGAQYMLNPTLVGQKMRCPNPTCKEVFEIKPVSRPDERDGGQAILK